jgi:ABC-type nitrate/sulfonate/bicarbonate transport system ATPase subunit
MQLSIQKHIELVEQHPQLPDWLFARNNVIMSQTITLDEVHMKELIIFLERYSNDFSIDDLRVAVVSFSDISLEYR